MDVRSGVACLCLAAVSGCAGAVPQEGDDDAGCWMHAFARKEYRPPVTTYTGPTHERFSLEGRKSLILGPGARLAGYGRPGYEAKTIVLASGASIPDLAAEDFHKRVDSFQLLCVPE